MTSTKLVSVLLAVGLLAACASIVSDNKSTTYIETDPDSVHLPADAAPITGAKTNTGEPFMEQQTPGERLRRVEKLYRENAITKEEYESLRKNILNDI